MKRARKQKLESLKSKHESAVPEVEPDHYQVKQINPKFSVFNRKLLRKAKRKGIKNLNEIIPQKKSVPKSQSLKQNLPLAKKPKTQSRSEEMAYEPEKWGKEYYKKMLVDDEKEIEFYEKKLGYGKEKGKIRNAKENKRDGIEDLYAFLDSVDKRIHTENFNYGNQLQKASEPLKFSLESSDEDEYNDKNTANPLEEQEDEKIDEEEGSNDDKSGENGLSEEFEEESYQEDEDELREDAEDGNFDEEELDDQVDGDQEEEASVEDDQERKLATKNAQPSLSNRTPAVNGNEFLKKANLLNQKEVSKLEKENTKPEQQNPVYEKLDSQMKLEEKAEAEKSIRACINRVSEGNIEAIFNKMNEIYNLHPKTLITEIHADLFIKACIEQPQCLHMIVAANTALLGALYQLYDNPLLAVFTKYLILKYRESQTLESEEQKTYIQKNIFLVFALTYDFNLFSAEFVLEIIVYLCNNFSELNLELISLIILNSGFKIRSDNPGILKRIIDYVKQAYDKFKSEKVKEANTEGCSKKMEFLMMNLNDIKINKKLPNNAKERLEFLSNWLQKSVIKKMNLIPKTFPPKFADIISNSFAHPRWYMPFNLESLNNEKEQHQRNFQGILSNMSNQEYIRLEKLAIGLKLTTDIRKRIFILMMGSQDYIEATQNIMKLKLVKKQMREIAVVILQACSQEENFNKFYAYLAQNMIEVDPNIKYSFQYSFWDHCKQLENYSLRKITNIAKLFSFLINAKVMGLSSLKGVDIDVPNEHLSIFLTVFFREFYSKNSLEDIKEIFRKVNQNEELALLREKLKEFIKTNFFKSEKTRKMDNQQEKEAHLEKIKQSLKHIETM